MTIRFAARLLLLTIVAATALTGAVAAETNSRPFLHPERIRYDSHCLTIDGKDVFIYSGAFHFFRCPKELWPDRFQKIKDAGFNTVETYVAWNWCEREMPAGTNDFSKVNLTDLDDFLNMAEKFGLYVLARPLHLRGVGHRRLPAMAPDPKARRAAARQRLAAQRRPDLSRVVQALV
jgi:hypothetical protein